MQPSTKQSHIWEKYVGTDCIQNFHEQLLSEHLNFLTDCNFFLFFFFVTLSNVIQSISWTWKENTGSRTFLCFVLFLLSVSLLIMHFVIEPTNIGCLNSINVFFLLLHKLNFCEGKKWSQSFDSLPCWS